MKTTLSGIVAASSLAFSLFLSAPAAGQCDALEDQRIVASDADVSQYFGISNDIDGDRAVVGAQENGPGTSGVVYLYDWDGSQWVEQGLLVASDASPGDAFGASVDIEGDTLMVGALASWLDKDNRVSAIYVFHHDGTQWVEVQKLTASDGVTGDAFATSMALDGEVLLVGAFSSDDPDFNTGAAYVFRFDGTQWNEEAKLVPSDPECCMIFGRSLALSGDWILIPASWKDKVYAYHYDGAQWVEVQKISVGGSYKQFGVSIDMDGETAIIGASQDDTFGVNAGAAYIFQFDGTQWVQRDVLIPTDTEDFNYFGYLCSMDGDRALINGYVGDGGVPFEGAAYVYRSDGSKWQEQVKLYRTDAAVNDLVGASFRIHGNRVLLGIPENDWRRGAVYAYELPDLSLGANQDSVQAGENLLLSTCGGQAGAFAMLGVVALNGVPTYVRIGIGAFDADGRWTMGGPAPGGLAGLVAEFESIGVSLTGRVSRSSHTTVTFQ